MGEQKLTNPYHIATEISKRKKKKKKATSETKTVDESNVESMQVDESPTEPICARFSYNNLIMLNMAPASEIPERKKKRKRREGTSEDSTSKTEKKKRREADEPVTEPSTSEIEEYLQSNSITLTSAKDGPSIKPVLSFDKLQIPPGLKAALSCFQHPTPIQACSWPPALQGQDVVGIAETGRYGDVTILAFPFLRVIPYQRKNPGVRYPCSLTAYQFT